MIVRSHTIKFLHMIHELIPPKIETYENGLGSDQLHKKNVNIVESE